MTALSSEIIGQFQGCGMLLLEDDLTSPARVVLVSPAESITAARMNQILTLATGLCFVALSPERVGLFSLARMKRPQTQAGLSIENSNSPDICISVEAREGVSTGISAADRATTVRILGEKEPNQRKLVHPGHIFPVETRPGGVLVRNALPEGALDLTRIAGFTEAALFMELLDSKGDFISSTAARDIATQNSLPYITLSELIRHRLKYEVLVSRITEARLPTRNGGELRSIIFKSTVHDGEHLALVKGEIDPEKPVLVRVQTEFTFNDVFGSKSSSRSQIHRTLEAIADAPAGVMLYLRRTQRGQLSAQIQASQDGMAPKPVSMMREYGLGAQILRDLGVRKVVLLSNSNQNLIGLDTFGIEIISTQRLPDLEQSHPQ